MYTTAMVTVDRERQKAVFEWVLVEDEEITHFYPAERVAKILIEFHNNHGARQQTTRHIKKWAGRNKAKVWSKNKVRTFGKTLRNKTGSCKKSSKVLKRDTRKGSKKS